MNILCEAQLSTITGGHGYGYGSGGSGGSTGGTTAPNTNCIKYPFGGYSDSLGNWHLPSTYQSGTTQAPPAGQGVCIPVLPGGGLAP